MGGPPERIVVGRIVKSHGIRGEVVVESLTDSPDRFHVGARFEATTLEGPPRALKVRSVRDDRGRLLVRFAETPDRTAADSFRGAFLTIAGVAAAPLPEGSYYPWQLEGLDVVDEDGVRLGRLARVDRSAASDLWVVDADGHEVLVPAVPEFIRDVDLDARRVVVHVIPGLFE